MVDNFHCYCGRGKRQTAYSCDKCLGIAAGTLKPAKGTDVLAPNRKIGMRPELGAPYAPSTNADASVDIYVIAAVAAAASATLATVPDQTPDFSGGGGTADGGGASGSW